MTVPLLVTTDWLAAHLADADVRVVDARWALLDKDQGRNAYRSAHIPGSAYLDVDGDLASPRGQGPGRHPLPTADRFAAAAARAGIGPGTHVIAYDFGDGSTAARVWWLLRYFGHARVSLLDGGMARWTAEGRPTESREPAHAPAGFAPVAHPELVVDAAAVERLRHASGTLILDSRLVERYEGRTEPVDPVAGHVPGARSRPYPDNLRGPDDPRFAEPARLREQFARLGAERAERIVCYCGSGVNACQNVFALELAGFPGALLYEGSWSDWCSVPEREVRTGAQP